MALVVGSRIGLISYTLGTDPRPGRVEHNAERALIEANAVIGGQGTEANRPTAGKARALYWDTGRNVLQWDTGTAWQDISTVGGGGPSLNIVTTGNGTEGTSLRGARADHVHFLPVATTTAHGAMSSTDKTFINNATSTAGVGRLVVRDAAGRAQFATPLNAADAATKSYVDSTIGGAAAPVVTYESNGLATPVMLYATDEVANANTEATPDTLVVRDVNGRAQFAYPSIGSDASTKLYVDTQISNHRHDGTHITSGTIAAARLPLVSSSANGAMSAADKVKLDNATSSVSNNALVMRSATGTIEVGNPALSTDATTKLYVDNALNSKANTNHTHDAAALTSGIIPTTRLPLASSSSVGMITAAQYSFLNSPSIDASGITSGTISNARLPVASSSSSGVISASAYSTIYSHSHTWTDISNKPSTFPPSGHSHSWTEITSKPSSFTPSSHSHPPSAISGSGVFDYDIVGGSNPAANTIYPGDVTQYNLNVGANGKFFRSSSAERFKTNVEPYEPDPRTLLGVKSVMYNQRREDGSASPEIHVGVIADWNVETVPELVTFGTDPGDDDGEIKVQDWQYIRWTAAHQVLHQWTAARDDEQDARLARIEEALGLPLFNPKDVP